MSAPSAGPAPVLPDVNRPDAGVPMFSTWRLGSPERQRTAVDAIAATWEARPWPAPDLLSYSVYEADDGDTLLHHSQWTDAESYRAFVRSGRQERNETLDAAVPGIERVGIDRYELYRSERRTGDARAHAEAPAGPGDGVGSPTPQWKRVQNFPGMLRGAGGAKRYRLAWSGARP